MQVLRLSLMRALSLVLMLMQNLLIVRFLSLEEIGRYYLVVTIAYLGNAILFVGADYYLQKKTSQVAIDEKISKKGLLSYIVTTSAAGGGLVWASSAIYFSISSSQEWLWVSILCSALAVGNYLGLLGRSLLQLAAKPFYSSIGPIVDGLSKVVLITLLVMLLSSPSAESVVLISCMGAWGAACVALLLFVAALGNIDGSYLGEPRKLFSTLVPIGCGGFLNWVQLQSYRPFIAGDVGGAQTVGAISLLSTLGSIMANSVYMILGQLEVSRQYQSSGRSTRSYLVKIFFLAIILCFFSAPSAAIFLWLTGKLQLINLIYVVILGVLIEAGNSVIGVCVNHLNIVGRSMWFLPLSSLVGALITYGILLFMPSVVDAYLKVSIALFLGQLVSVFLVLITMYIIFKEFKYAQ